MNYDEGTRTKHPISKTVNAKLSKLSDLARKVKEKGFDSISTREHLARMNTLLSSLPEAAWPKKPADIDSWPYPKRVYKTSGMSLTLGYNDEGEMLRRDANLAFASDDHTSWVIEHPKKKGTWQNFDIGGS